MTLESGERIHADAILWVTQAAAPAWLGDTGLATDARGFLAVHPTLESTSHPGIFAAGDCAAVLEHPRPKAGVFAVRQGPPLADNLRRKMQGKPLRPYTPQREFLSIISTGDRHAVAARGRYQAAGGWVWRWKDWIDRRFMARYADLPEMDPDRPRGAHDVLTETLNFDSMRCGGCGSKLGPDLLASALAEADVAAPTDPHGAVSVGLAQPDDAAVISPPPGKLAVHTVDAFRDFIDDPYLLGRIAANHSLSDVHAMGAEPHSALAIVSLPVAATRKMRAELVQLLRGARDCFDAENTALVGGHSSEGLELSIGFSINAYAERKLITPKAGARPGDALVLSKPLGTGILFAADMRGKARGRWIASALDSMLLSNRAAARVLRAHGAHAVTDVTGFGLAGHLGEMLFAGGCGARVNLDTLPCLPGAETLANSSVRSTLHEEIEHHARALLDGAALPSHRRVPLLFDPQTSGGLLAAVSGGQADACLRALRDAGCVQAEIIGVVTEAAEPRLEVLA